MLDGFDDGYGRSPRKKSGLSSTTSHRNSARRVLFGRPPREETNKWLKSLEDKSVKAKSQKWGFDFRRNRPLASSSTTNGPRALVEYECLDEEAVPRVYHSMGASTGERNVSRKRTNPHTLQNSPVKKAKGPSRSSSVTSPTGKKSPPARKAKKKKEL